MGNAPSVNPFTQGQNLGPNAPLVPGGVLVYASTNYQGKPWLSFQNQKLGAHEERSFNAPFPILVKSLSVDPGYRVTFYQGANYSGPSNIYQTNKLPNLNLSIQSYKVDAIGSGIPTSPIQPVPIQPAPVQSAPLPGQQVLSIMGSQGQPINIGNLNIGDPKTVINNIVSNAIANALQTCGQVSSFTGNAGQIINLANVNPALSTTISTQCALSASIQNNISLNLTNSFQQWINSVDNAIQLSPTQRTDLQNALTSLQNYLINQLQICLRNSGNSAQINNLIRCAETSNEYNQRVNSIANLINQKLASNASPTSAPPLPRYSYPSGVQQPSGVPYTTPPTQAPPTTQPPRYSYPSGVVQPSGVPYTTGTQLPASPYVPPQGQPTGAIQLSGYLYNIPQSPYSKPIVNVTAGPNPGFVNVYYADGSSAQVMQSGPLNPVSNEVVDINGHPIRSSGVLTSQQLQNIPYSRYDQTNGSNNWLWILLIIIIILLVIFFAIRSTKY